MKGEVKRTRLRARQGREGMLRLRRVFAEAVAVFLALNCAAVAGAAVLAHGGRFSATLDILSHFAMLYVASALAAMALALLLPKPRRRLVLALGAVAIAASLALIAPSLIGPQPPRAPADAPDQIKVIQFNILRENRGLDEMIAWLIAENPDVVTITECTPEFRDRFIERTGWSVAGSNSNLMIFTPRRRLAMHRPEFRERVPLTYINATYASASGPFEVVTAHFDWPTRPKHARQQPVLRQIVKLRWSDRLIVTGDLNAAGWTAELRRLERETGLTRRDRLVLTFPADRRGFRWPYPVLPIDHVYAGPGWATVKVERGPRLGSDHYPVVVTLAPVAPR